MAHNFSCAIPTRHATLRPGQQLAPYEIDLSSTEGDDTTPAPGRNKGKRKRHLKQYVTGPHPDTGETAMMKALLAVVSQPENVPDVSVEYEAGEGTLPCGMVDIPDCARQDDATACRHCLDVYDLTPGSKRHFSTVAQVADIGTGYSVIYA